MKTYSAASDEVNRTIERMRKEWHPELENVTIHALFIYDAEDSQEQVLKHGGYPAAAVVRITPLRERALGVADAVIIVDRAYWLSIKAQQCDALIDHELYHLERAKDTDTNLPLFDSLNRPKLEMRKHDRHFGWFDEIAQRHGNHSIEVIQAKSLLAETQQLYFDFAPPQKRPDKASAVADEADPLYEDAAVFVTTCGLEEIGTSRLQTQLHIGYNRAARLLEALEAKGYVGPPPSAGGKRPILTPATH